jgi:cytochrome b561
MDQARIGLARHFSAVDKLLHWAVAGVLVVQWVTSDAYHRTHGSLLRPRQADLIEYAAHRYLGLALGALALAQLIARLRRRRADPIERDRFSWLAAAVHWFLPLVLVLQALLGVAAVYVAPWVGGWHSLLWNVVLALVTLHLAGIGYHAILRDGVVSRIFPSRFGSR